MITCVSSLLNAVQTGQAKFEDVLNYINQNYDYTPAAFSNGPLHNAANENAGSCRVFAFAQLNHLSATDTLSLCAEHYPAVLATPAGTDHPHMRAYTQEG
ncbi:MAG: HopJ type III effector protein, partial [Pseudomonadota bacterium]|nr:HopJ type III effector protein [Pseudomonadota bacterium]